MDQRGQDLRPRWAPPRGLVRSTRQTQLKRLSARARIFHSTGQLQLIPRPMRTQVGPHSLIHHSSSCQCLHEQEDELKLSAGHPAGASKPPQIPDRSVSDIALSCVQLFVTPWTIAAGLLCPWDSPGRNTGVGGCALLRGIFLAQGSIPCPLSFLPWQADSLLRALSGKSFFLIISDLFAYLFSFQRHKLNAS